AVVKRLLAESVAGGEQLALPAIPDGEGEHAVEPVHAGGAPLFVGAEDHLGVAPRAEAVALPLQLSEQFDVVVDLAGIGQGETTIVADHGLGCRVGKIDDRQAAMSQERKRRPIGRAGPDALAVGPTVGEARQSLSSQPRIGAPVAAYDPKDAAHAGFIPPVVV